MTTPNETSAPTEQNAENWSEETYQSKLAEFEKRFQEDSPEVDKLAMDIQSYENKHFPIDKPEQTGWKYNNLDNKFEWDIFRPDGTFYDTLPHELHAKEICSRFNRLDALEKLLSEAEKELPSEEVIMEWFPQRDDDGRFITKNIYHRGGARRFRSEASKTIAGLKSQLSDKEKEIERMKEALKMIEIETWRKAKMCCEVQSDFSVRSNGYDAICNHYNALLTPKQG